MVTRPVSLRSPDRASAFPRRRGSLLGGMSLPRPSTICVDRIATLLRRSAQNPPCHGHFQPGTFLHTQGGVGECGARDNSSGRARSAHPPTLRPYVYLFAPVAFCSASKTKGIPLPSESIPSIQSAYVAPLWSPVNERPRRSGAFNRRGAKSPLALSHDRRRGAFALALADGCFPLADWRHDGRRRREIGRKCLPAPCNGESRRRYHHLAGIHHDQSQDRRQPTATICFIRIPSSSNDVHYSLRSATSAKKSQRTASRRNQTRKFVSLFAMSKSGRFLFNTKALEGLGINPAEARPRG